MSFARVAFLAVTISATACGGSDRAADGRPTAAPIDRTHRLEQVDDAAVVQLHADGFADLSLRKKTLVWHLYRAAIAGRDIFYDQRYVHNLEMRDILEAIVTHSDGVDATTLAEVQRYTKLFWLNTGAYNNLTAQMLEYSAATRAFR